MKIGNSKKIKGNETHNLQQNKKALTPKIIKGLRLLESTRDDLQTSLLAGLEEKGRLSSNPKVELYKCITSHTARRSFATNLYIDGYPIIEVMKITGHKTEKAFLKYIKVSKLDAAKRLNAYMKRKWEEKRIKASDSILRIA